MREFKYDVIQLITGVRDRPCLWDKTSDSYKDRVERRSAWEEIFNMLDEKYEDMTREEKRLTGEHILGKWTNVRDTFIKSLKTKMGRPKKRYVHYDHLKFLTKITPEESSIEHNDFNESNEEVPYMKQEVVVQSEDESTSYVPKKRSKQSNFDDTDSGYYIIDSNYQKDKTRTDFDDLNSTDQCASEASFSQKRKSKRYSTELNDKDTRCKKKTKKEKVLKDVDDNNDIDFIAIEEADNPRVMNEDEAFFASLLPTIVKYSEDERLEFRIEVLGVMKKIKDKRKWSD